MLARTDSRARALVLLIVVSLLASAIGARLVWWQVFEREWLAAAALHQLAQEQTLPAERGEITDRNGELLATSVELQSVFVIPPSIAGSGPGIGTPGIGTRPAGIRGTGTARQRPQLGLAQAPRHPGGGRAGQAARHPRHRDAAGDEARLPGQGDRG